MRIRYSVAMTDINLEQAQLMRVLGTFFGVERVVPRMSLLAVCGGQLPKVSSSLPIRSNSWASQQKCLFTVVDQNDNPLMVFELFGGFTDVIDLTELEHQQALKPFLKASGVAFISLDSQELLLLLETTEEEEFFSFLEEKIKDAELS